jgi:hypothetical protein
MIHQTFQEATKARGARRVHIVNLGLEPWEALDLELDVEDVKNADKRKPVANYVLEREDGDYWEEWLQTRRVELNAMTTPQFIAWLDRKMAEHGDGKLIPPPEVVTAELEEKLGAELRTLLTARILREADFEGQLTRALNEIERPLDAAMVSNIRQMLEHAPEREWREYIQGVAADLAASQVGRRP